MVAMAPYQGFVRVFSDPKFSDFRVFRSGFSAQKVSGKPGDFSCRKFSAEKPEIIFGRSDFGPKSLRTKIISGFSDEKISAQKAICFLARSFFGCIHPLRAQKNDVLARK